jgi:ATP-dependent protease ClpP protease subunit
MRKELIQKIQEKRDSKVITYVTGDRQFALASIAEDAVRPLYDHLLSVGPTEKIDMLLYSRGGNVSVPWRIVSMIREFCNEFSILVPYKAHSAATLMSLGADQIVMGKKAELSPIDPTLMKVQMSEIAGPPQEISVEDVNSYVSFIKERANINDQAALSQTIALLVNNISPLTLGSVNRENSHIRLVARKLLTSRREKGEEARINSIIETLTEKIYSHGHAIGRKEAKEIGLPVILPEETLEQSLWDLYLEYEKYLSLNEPIDPILVLQNNEESTLENIPLAVIESENKLHAFKSKIEFKKKRQIPQNMQINLNIAVNLPPTIKPEQIPQEAQQILQQLIGQINQIVQQQVQKEMVRQSPEIGLMVRSVGGRWCEIEGEC